MKAKLEFPHSNDGVIEGISDAGIETFKGSPYKALAREQGQNSGDARKKNAKGPVKIRYELIQIPTSQFPGYKELKAAVVAATEYWQERKSEKTIRFLNKAMAVLKKKEIPCLKISDRNTTGLTGSLLHDRGNWFGLTKAKGVSEKDSGAGGSFGIGKNAFFANSLIRTVFFSTYDIEGQWACQGVTNLVSHLTADKKLTKAIGFYGDPDGYLPLTGKANIPSSFRCDDIGTDIIIAGFDEHENWEREILQAFTENFYVAIHDGLLEISVVRDSDKGVYELNSATLGGVIRVAANQNGSREAKDLVDFYDALTSEESISAETEIDGLGKVQLSLLKREGARKRIAMFRKTGLKIFEKDRLRTPVEFVGVFRCLGEEGNSLLRVMEPPAHDKWEPERCEDPRHASRILTNLNDWIRERVAELQTPSDEDRQSIPGMERLLPDDFEDPFDSPGKKEGDPHPEEGFEVKGVIRKVSVRAPTFGGNSSGDGDGKPGGGGKDGPPKEDVTLSYRTFHDPNQGQYRMLTTFPEVGTFDIHIYAVGDDGKTEPISLQNTKLILDGKMRKVTATSNRIALKIVAPGIAEVRFDSVSAVPRTMLARIQRHG